MTSSTWRTLDGKPPRIIAHRGASGERPEHTLAAYERAIVQGADVIEPDLVATRDRVLVARHDVTLARSTDIATRAAFADRRGARVADDWLVCDFDDAEIATLRANQPFPGRDRRDDGRWSIPRFDAILDLLDRARLDTRADLLVYPELKEPATFTRHGIDIGALFVDAMRTRYADPPAAPVWLQCFDLDTLLRVYVRYPLRCHWLVDERGAAALDDARLAKLARQHVAGLGIAVPALFDTDGQPRDLIGRAHAHGLAVHAWTYRDDRVPAPFTRIDEAYRAAFAAGIDALFCDFPASGLAARDAYANGGADDAAKR